jgi:hypothetical protein
MPFRPVLENVIVFKTFVIFTKMNDGFFVFLELGGSVLCALNRKFQLSPIESKSTLGPFKTLVDPSQYKEHNMQIFDQTSSTRQFG